KREALADLRIVLVLFVLIATLAYAIAWWGSFLLILRPARRLLIAAERFRGGDHSARVDGPYGRNEIGTLARSFNAFADAFQKIHADLTATAENLKGIIDNIMEGIITADERGAIISFNRAVERITGHAAKDVIGRNVDILIPEPHRSRHDRYLAAYLAGAPAKVIGKGMRRLEVLHKNGTLIPIEFGVAETRRGGARIFIGVLHDLSDQVAAEAADQKRAREIESLFQASPAAIIALDRDTKVVWWNAAAERIFGFTAAEAIGRPHPVVPQAEVEHFQNHFRRAMAGESLRDIRATRQAKGGRMVDVEFSSAPLMDARHNVIGVVYAVNDVTERVQLERQLLQAQKMEAVGQLTGGIAHDFNNLLGVLIGNLDLLRERVAHDRETLELADAALEAGVRGAELNKRLLAFSRRQALAPETVDVNAALTAMARMLRRSLGERIEIDLHCADGVWPVRVDPVQLETAIVNLGVNARDAMPHGGTLTLETRNAPLDADYAARHESLKPGDYVMIAVSDSGVGMTPEVLARVFDPFFTTKPVGQGTGLGLSMVYGFLKQSGGHVNIYSEPGEGTTIRLYLPRDTAGTEAPRTADAAEKHSPTYNELVLAVEDNPDMRRIAVRQLKELGYRVVEAENADKALALLDEGLKPDLAFLDVIMPGTMDGLDLAQHIEKRLPGVGILMTSGFTERATPEARKNGDKTIPFPILDKPYRKDDLARAMRAALDNRKNGEHS
ncbi:MAG: PAS domain S-box protein, partial [Pseudomonadota bacterium]